MNLSYQIWYIFVYQKSLNWTFKTRFLSTKSINNWFCAVIKKPVWKVRIKAFWYTIDIFVLVNELFESFKQKTVTEKPPISHSKTSSLEHLRTGSSDQLLNSGKAGSKTGSSEQLCSGGGKQDTDIQDDFAKMSIHNFKVIYN